jgi:dTDP-4-amino-4,6-dideoxygalactose transaminase
VFKEIGGNFWLEPEQLEERECADLDFRYVNDNEVVVYTSSGRGAISLLLDQIRITGGALLPLYTCESVIKPFIKKGYDVHFYDINTDLSVNEQSFMECVNSYKPGVVLLHAYFGFDTLHNLRFKYQWLREKGIIIIEDITHSLFSNFEKNGADYYLASLRKWLALPDGGIAITTRNKIKMATYTIFATHKKLVNLNIKAIRLKYEYTKNLDIHLKNEYRKLFYSTEELLNTDYGFYAMSRISKAVLCQTNFAILSATRRSNYAYLLNYLTQQSCVEPVFNDYPADVVPFYLSVYVKCDRTKLSKYLAEAEIYAPILWDIPNACLGQLTHTTSYVYNNILSIPCDQRYTHKDLERIVIKLSEYTDKMRR